MQYLKELGLHITLNLHDASGVNSWDAKFAELASYLGLPANSSVVPFNLQNATVAYAVEDIVLGDLLYNKSIDFWWIDWQQGGSNGGMTGNKQNPTIWLAHLRCTDRNRNGDITRGMTLARWGGMGGHRYQVGFSGDVNALTWGDLAYQPYFSATAANVLHSFWSHDIEGPWDDLEMYTRWLQVGAFSGTMRSHDRGMSGGGCSDTDNVTPGWGPSTGTCSIVEPWNVGPLFFEANRFALRSRERLIPYIYNYHRSAFMTGVGLMQPMYYDNPTNTNAYLMDQNGNNVQYMFGSEILFSPVVMPANASNKDPSYSLAVKSTWLPDGIWFDANTGVLTTATGGNFRVNKGYALLEIPLWYKGGSVIPYLPLESYSTLVGIARMQYNFLGFKIIPGASIGSTLVYEDDGATTAYLTSDEYVQTTFTYTRSGPQIVITISSVGSYPAFPATRAYQVRLPNGVPPSSVTVNSAPVSYNRYGSIASKGKIPTTSSWYYDFMQGEGLGPVIDVVGVSTSSVTTIVITNAVTISDASMSGVYGAIMHAIWAKQSTDLERSTPGSNTVEAAPTSVLSSSGDALAYLAGQDVNAFVSVVQSIPGLLSNAISDMTKLGSDHSKYAVMLLQVAMQ
jgi:alpha-glucosidase